MPLTSLSLDGCGQVRDLTPLAGMPLTSLNLTPLAGMPLTSLDLRYCPADPAPVRGIKTLKTINDKPAEEFWKEYDARQKGKQ
jgi:hypothetical protein